MGSHASNNTYKGKSLGTFFVLVFLMSAVFWLLGAVSGQVLPRDTAINLPISSLMGICPIIAGLIIAHRENGSGGVKQLLRRTVDYQRIKRKIWYLPILLLMPVTMILANGFNFGRPEDFPISPFSFSMVLVSSLLFYIEAASEEVGWQGYAFDPMEQRWNALTASLILGIVWSIWHTIPFIQAHQSANWIAWQSINLLVTRVLIIWIYNNTGKSVFAAILYHAMYNISTLLLPNFGLNYEPIAVTIILAAFALIVVVLWSPKTLASYRIARSRINVQLARPYPPSNSPEGDG